MDEPRVVADIMTREVVTLNEEDNLADLAAGMERYALRHLPVVDGRKLVGLVSHRDVLRLTRSTLERAPVAAERDLSLKQQTFVASVMTRHVDTARPETTVADAARILLAGKFGCLPVVDARGDLIGIVTEHDLLRELVAAMEREELSGAEPKTFPRPARLP
jgi:CBS domain-containing protein